MFFRRKSFTKSINLFLLYFSLELGVIMYSLRGLFTSGAMVRRGYVLLIVRITQASEI
jgi:hypothetical protein